MDTAESRPGPPETDGRAPYETPRLATHGSLQDLTRDDAQDVASIKPA
jgi:hypothetical protein